MSLGFIMLIVSTVMPPVCGCAGWFEILQFKYAISTILALCNVSDLGFTAYQHKNAISRQERYKNTIFYSLVVLDVVFRYLSLC